MVENLPTVKQNIATWKAMSDNIAAAKIMTLSVDVMHHFLEKSLRESHVNTIQSAGLKLETRNSAGFSGYHQLLKAGMVDFVEQKLEELARNYPYLDPVTARKNIMQQLFSLPSEQYKQLSTQIALKMDIKAMTFIWCEILPICEIAKQRPITYQQSTFVIVNDLKDDTRLASANGFLFQNPLARVILIEKEQASTGLQYQQLKPLLSKGISPQQKLVFHGHGPHLCGLSGDKFAEKVDSLLSQLKLAKDTKLKITLTSCNCGIDVRKISEDDFLAQFIFTMARRYSLRPIVTAAVTKVIVFSNGEIVAAEYDKFDDFKYIHYWQGSSFWLNDEACHELKKGMVNLDKKNYRNNLIFEYVYKEDDRIHQTRKHKTSQSTGGLHTISSTLN